jgi:hypothetical protein
MWVQLWDRNGNGVALPNYPPDKNAGTFNTQSLPSGWHVLRNNVPAGYHFRVAAQVLGAPYESARWKQEQDLRSTADLAPVSLIAPKRPK